MAASKETLYEHINEALLFYQEQFVSKNYGFFLENKLRLWGCNFKEGAIDIVGLAILCHDLGKAHRLYQEAIEKYGKEGVWHPTVNHELYSVAISNCILKLNTEVKEPILASIALHHQYMRELKPIGINKPLEMDLKELRDLLVKLSTRHGLSKYLNLNELKLLSSTEIFEVVTKLRERIITNKTLYRLAMLILHPLVICDNVSAFKHRQDRTPRILKDVMLSEQAYVLLRRCMGLDG